MFNIYIGEKEIQVGGNIELVTPLYNTIKRTLSSTTLHSHPFNERVNFTIDLWNIFHSVDGNSIPQIVLNHIETNHILINERTKYLFQYWAFEVKMIVEMKSYRSNYLVSKEVTSCETLYTILERCKEKNYVPAPEDLFNLIEQSNKKGETLFHQPIIPYEYELRRFEHARSTDFQKLRLLSYLVAQGSRTPSCGFFKLPKKINETIVSLTANPRCYNETDARNRVSLFFSQIEGDLIDVAREDHSKNADDSIYNV